MFLYSQNGELLRIMKGDTIGSTDLHLVCNDRLLVGAVHADMEINEYSGRKGVFNHTLQVGECVDSDFNYVVFTTKRLN